MKIYYLIRHGRATYSNTGYGDQTLTKDLLPEGREQIQRLAEYIKEKNIATDFCVSSPVPRCRETAEIITQVTGKNFQLDDRLSDQYQEGLAKVSDRVSRLLKEIEEQGHKKVMISTHGVVIAILTHLLVDREFQSRDEFDFPPPAGVRIITGRQVQELKF